MEELCLTELSNKQINDKECHYHFRSNIACHLKPNWYDVIVCRHDVSHDIMRTVVTSVSYDVILYIYILVHNEIKEDIQMKGHVLKRN